MEVITKKDRVLNAWRFVVANTSCIISSSNCAFSLWCVLIFCRLPFRTTNLDDYWKATVSNRNFSDN